MEVEGNIKLIGKTQTFGEKNFAKREVVVTTLDQYPQDIMIEFVQDKCDMLDKYKVNDPVKVSINLRGREWVNPQGVSKYFNTIQGWRIEKLNTANDALTAGAKNIDTNFEPVGSEEDDLPF